MIDGDLRYQMERLSTGLVDLGIDAQLSETPQTQQKIGTGGLFKVNSSLGLINIQDGPIRWINLKEARENKSRHGAIVRYTYYMDYGVPYQSGARVPKDWVFSVRVKRFPIFGAVVGIRWTGRGLGREIADRLNADSLLKRPSIIDSDFEITSYPEHECWVLSAGKWRVPSRDQWDAYQALCWPYTRRHAGLPICAPQDLLTGNFRDLHICLYLHVTPPLRAGY